MEDVIVQDIHCHIASRFLAGPGSILYSRGSTNGVDWVALSPSPTKLIPTLEKYGETFICELSVVLHSEDEAPHWNEGEVPCGGKAPQGALDFGVKTANDLGLTVELDTKSWSENHANVRNWPEEDALQTKKAMSLAKKAVLVVNMTQQQRLLKYCAQECFKKTLPEKLVYDQVNKKVLEP